MTRGLFTMDEKEDMIWNYLNEELNDIPAIVHNAIFKNDTRINSRSEINEISDCIHDFDKGYTNGRFLVLPGIRGVGKTTLLYETYHYLIKEMNVSPNNILFFSCDEVNRIVDCDIKEIVDIYLDKKHDTKLSLLDENIFILIDESQFDKNWALSGKIIFDKTEKIFMIFTGSSALNLEYNADAARRMTKETITPLNYCQHLRLKYNINSDSISNALKKMIFEGDTTDAMEKEEEMKKVLVNNLDYNSNDWNTYLKYGGFPILFNERNNLKLRNRLVDMVNRVVTEDMGRVKNISENNKMNAQRLLRKLSLQKSNEISQNKLSKQLQTSSANVKLILDILEKTHIIFHCESFGSANQRSNKSWKYYFATSSLKHALSSHIGNPEKNTNEFTGVLLENLVASTLNNTRQNRGDFFTLYYDSNRKGNVDFIVDNSVKNPIPIEVGLGKKDNKQIKNAINNYESDYGIIVSKKTDKIEKHNDIIRVPAKTFSFL